MIIDWTNTEVTGISGIKIKMPNEAKISIFCERLKSQNNISTELGADWKSWWSCKQLPLHINSCYEAAQGVVVF